MRTISAPFHPHLDDALVEEILKYKQPDPLVPLLIVVPSDVLRRRLKVLLAVERRLDLLNLHLLSFRQLSLRLREETQGGKETEIFDDAFLEEVLRHLIRTGNPGAAAFAGIEEKAGGCAALWQTLRDLKDGVVEPARALEALTEGHFGRADKEKISSLFNLLETFLSSCKSWQVRDYSDLDILAMERVPSSDFLKQFKRILYYGFYDLTQVQVDLLHAVSRNYPTTLFFPLVAKHPAWAYAQRFYERHIQGLADEGEGRDRSREPQMPAHAALFPDLALFGEWADDAVRTWPKNFSCTIFSCSGARDEALTAAKETLRLVSEEGMAFHEIGIVGRSLEPYIPWIKEVFSEHRIPITTSAQEPLVQFPLAKAVLQLIRLPASGYLRSSFVDLVSAPFFNIDPFCRDGSPPRPDQWDILTRHLGITKGQEEWRRLERYLDKEFILSESGEENENPETLTIAGRQIRILWNIFNDLYENLESLPREASWREYAIRWRVLLEKYLGIGKKETRDGGPEEQVKETILNTIESLAGLDVMNSKVSLDYFVQTYQHWLERSAVPLGDENIEGVAVLDAMSARGIPFRALFILGLNEGMFPRTIREDAFLRDRDRRILETVIGYKVSEKLAAFDEEKLLFTLLVGAARERLYCLYQRSDERGRALAPSWYLAELRRALPADGTGRQLQEKTIPRGIVEKRETEQFCRNELLPAEELAIQLSLESQDPTPLVEIFSLSPALYKRGLRAMNQMESPSGKLSDYDGILGQIPAYWERLREQGISPTALERYALCPFQFFARNILGLGRLGRPEEMAVLAPAGRGEILHRILKSFYQELIDRDYFVAKDSPLDFLPILARSAQKIFTDYEAANPVGLPVAWEIMREDLTAVLSQVVRLDFQELSQSDFRPIALEQEGEAPLKGKWPAPLGGLTVRGRMDRLDHHPGQNRYRVIDYKFKSGRNPSPEDRDLRLYALRGKRLQPPLYLLLGERLALDRAGEEAGTKIEAAFYFVAPNWPAGPLVTQFYPADAWDGKMGAGLRETLSLLLDGIHKGRFFIHPGIYCRHCEVSEVCRKNHLPTSWRAENDPVTRPHDDLRQKKAPK